MYIGIFLGAVLISSISQVLLKKSAMKHYNYKFGDYINPYVISAYGLLFLSMFLTVFAYKGVDLKTGPVLEASGYIWAALLSTAFLKERVSGRKKTGLLLIIIGIIVSNL